MNAKIGGTGSCLGEKEYSNFDLWGWGEIKEGFDIGHWKIKLPHLQNDAAVFDAAVRQITGIEKRRFSPEKGAEELGAEAAAIAMDDAGVKASDLDLILVSTFTPDKEIPPPGQTIGHLIGAPHSAAMTHNETCSSFIYSLYTGFNALQTGNCENILIVATDKLSRETNFQDYATAYLFGDGAGAVILQADQEGGMVCPPWVGSDYSEESHILKYYAEKITMGGGKNVLKAAVEAMAASAHNALLYYNLGEQFGYSYKKIREHFEELKEQHPLEELLKNIDCIIPHQANGRITESLAKKMGYGNLSKFANTIGQIGNTSAGSQPISMDMLIQQGRIARGDKILLTAVGGGYTLGAAVLRY